MLKIGREGRGLRTQVPLQPLADGVADRSAGLAVDLFTVVVCSAIHEAALRLFQCDEPQQVAAAEIVSPFSRKDCKKAAICSGGRIDKRPRTDTGRGLLMSKSIDSGQ